MVRAPLLATGLFRKLWPDSSSLCWELATHCSVVFGEVLSAHSRLLSLALAGRGRPPVLWGIGQVQPAGRSRSLLGSRHVRFEQHPDIAGIGDAVGLGLGLHGVQEGGGQTHVQRGSLRLDLEAHGREP